MKGENAFLTYQFSTQNLVHLGFLEVNLTEVEQSGHAYPAGAVCGG